MVPSRSLAFATLLLLSASASASSFFVTTDALVGGLAATGEATSDATSSLRDFKLVRAAREDAAAFVASQGAIRGVRLEAALQHIRSHAPQLSASDMQLAEAIISL